MKTFQDFGIEVPAGSSEEVFTTCPQCSPNRKHSKAKCMSVNTAKGVWVCHHCDWRGTLKGGTEDAGRKIYRRPTWTPSTAPSQPLQDWFAGRGISAAIVAQEGIALVEHYLAQVEDRVPCIAFPYRKRGDVVNVKYRGLATKAFQQVAGAEKVLFRQDCITRESVVIVEGEMDALSLVQAGITSVVSVPDGAPSVSAKNYAAKFTYLDQTPNPFEDVEKIVLAVDSDEPGQVLKAELARRLGIDRCWFVTWPDACKDANDVLVRHGVETLRQCIEQAKPFPVQDGVTISQVAGSVVELYFKGLTRGLSTGWDTVDLYWTVEAGQLTVVTGTPGHGKSEWLDALMLNLATEHEWRFAVCSPENFPVEGHIAKLLEKLIGRPFRVGPSDRMTPTDVAHGLEWLHDRMTFIVPSDQLSIPQVLERAAVLVRRVGIRGLVIDPFNEFDHTRPPGQTETEYIGHTLTTLRQWARKWQVHVWLVAHPQKLYRREDGSYPVPTPWDINGSANFRNKADNCLTVWRDENEPDSPVQIHVQKVRHKHIGHVGMAELLWERRTGRYTVPPLTIQGGMGYRHD